MSAVMKIIHIYNSEYSRGLKEQGREEAHEGGREEEGVHESYAQCGCAARLGEFVTASGGYLTARAGVSRV